MSLAAEEIDGHNEAAAARSGGAMRIARREQATREEETSESEERERVTNFGRFFFCLSVMIIGGWPRNLGNGKEED